MSTLQAVELGVLGPLQVRRDGAPVMIPGAKPRAILTMLGLHGGSVVSAETLIELLWGDDPPRTAAKALQTHISLLRRSLGDGFVLTSGTGWTLAESGVDAARYKSAARLGRDAAAAGDTSQAVSRFEEALALWRGIPELPDGRRGTSEKTRWIEGHAALVEDRADALLVTGRAAEIVGELEAAVADAPLRERRWGQLMLALYRAGRQGDALGAYQRARALLADELGVDPGPDLRRLEAAIVGQDTALEIPAAQDLPSVTRTVTFLLTDIEGSTAAWEADADAMAVALARHDELVEQVVTSRGGRLIKTRGEGDATFSVFERASAAAAAAIELQDAIFHEPWGLQDPMRIRVALHTGEVELRDGDYFGRAVNRAARLRSLAVAGQILCSGAIAELVVDSLPDDVVLADLGMRQLRNLARPEHVFELRLETASDVPPTQAGDEPLERPGLPAVLTGPGPFVGRGRELEGLVSAWQTVLAGGTHAVLIAGEPGVGKTRLAGEWSQQAYQRGAMVLYGRCDEDLGAPYQPFAEALRSLVRCLGASRLRGMRGVEALLTLVPGLTEVLPDLAAPTRADPETERYALFDAVVALLELASAGAPVVLILDDLHWAAKPTLLLLRHLLRFGDRAPVQIVGTYRSTDLDRSHPLAAMLADLHRAAGSGTANRLALSGLDEADVTAYVTEAGYHDEELARALASVTGGNPFFLIEALRHVDETGGVWDPTTLPQGVRETVSRRLSRLTAETNTALAAAAVVGSRFALDLVEKVVEEDLVDAFDEACKAGIVIEEPGGRYRFNHAIVRQSLLAELPSVRRLRLHQRIATTLENEPGTDDELLAELAHHYFECAWAGNAAKAVEYCRRAADQAVARLAYEGAADLYGQALHALEEIDDELPDRDDQAGELLVARCEALLAAGDVASAAGAVSKLQQATVNSPRLAAWATCFDGQLSMLIHPERLDEVETALRIAAQKLAELDDAAGEANAHTVRAACLARLGRIGDGEIALDDALTAARRARDHRRVNAVLAGAPLAALWGPNPVPRAGGRCLDVVRLLRITTDSPAVEATSTRCQAVLEAFRGRAEAARRMIDSARRTVTELGLRHARLEVEQFAGIVELIADDPTAAEPHFRQAYNGFRRMGLDADTAETAALLGRTCLALDRDTEADELCVESERLAGHALKASIAWRTLRARLLSRGHEYGEARRIAEAAVALAERTDALVDHGDSCLTLATVLGAAGDSAGARTAAERAVDLYERKGAAALAERARRVLGERDLPAVPAPPEPSPVVELDNACIRAGKRLLAAADREAWDEFEQLFAPDIFVESHRKIVGFTQIDGRSDWQGHNRRLLQTTGMRLTAHDIAVRGERLALARLSVGTADASPGAPQDEFLQIYGIDEEGRISLQIWFDPEDMDAAIAELDAAHARFEDEARSQARRVENAASRTADRYLAHFAARDWDALAKVLADDFVTEDRRRAVNAGIRHGRIAEIANLRAAADVGITYFTSVVIAARGERLILAHLSGGRGGSEEFVNEVLGVAETDSHDQIAAIVLFERDDFDSAIAELDARYLAGEAAAHAHTWSVVTGTYASVSQQELPALTPDCVTIDHRRVTAFAPGEMTAYIRAGWEIDQTIQTYVEVVHRLSDLGAVCTYAAHAVSREGFDGAFRGVNLATVSGDMVNRSELFDQADLDVALARLGQLSRSTPRLENAASQVSERALSYFATRDWDALAKVLADDFVTDDHRRAVNAGIRRGRDAEIENWQAAANVGFTNLTLTVAATRGGRLILSRLEASGRDPAAIQGEFLVVVEIDADERIVAFVVFDPDDFDTAIAELDARYLAGEAAVHAHVLQPVMDTVGELNRHKPGPMLGRLAFADHRRVPFGSAENYGRAIEELWTLVPDARYWTKTVHALDAHGLVSTLVIEGTDAHGNELQWARTFLFLSDGLRVEVYEEGGVDAALARFEEIRPQARRLENAASQVSERHSALFAARDWDALAKVLTDDFVTDDRRRAVNAGIRRGRDAEIANLQAAAEVGIRYTAFDVIATRGERLILAHASVGSGGSAEFATDVLSVVEINSHNQIAAFVIFELDDFEAAIAELDALYLAGEAAAHAGTWSVISGGHAALSRRELPPLTPDCVSIDHRRATSFAPGELTAYFRAGFDLDQNIRSYVEIVHRLSDVGAVCTHAAHGVSKEGFEAEWRGVDLLTVDGDMVNRCEVFDETNLGTALARFDQLSAPALRLGNAASRATERLLACFAARDWEAMAELMADYYLTADRRRAVNAGTRRGRDAAVEEFRSAAGVGITNAMSAVIATRGSHLALTRARFSSQDHRPESFQIDALLVAAIDADGKIAEAVVFDLDDFDAAFAELDTRYIAGEAAAHANTWSVIAGTFVAHNRREFPATTTDAVSIDHRRVASFAPGEGFEYIRAGWDLDQTLNLYIETADRLNDRGAVFTWVGYGTSHEGFQAEWRGVNLMTVDGEMLDRSEVFDGENLDAALARFEQLTQPAPRLENAASQVDERFWSYYATRDWDSMAELLAEGVSTDDRRRIVNAGKLHGRDVHIESMQALAELEANMTSAVIAIRGERLALTHLNRDLRDGEFGSELLYVIEIDANHRIAAGVFFDTADIDAAFAELDARYLAGEAAAQANTWSVIAGGYAALNRHELPATTPDGVSMDHRRGGAFAPGELSAYIRAAWENTPNAKIYVEVVHQLSSLGAVVTQRARGVSLEGFDAEWRDIAVMTVDGGLISRGEIFDEADLAAALATFDQLSRPGLENTATRVQERIFSYIAARDWDAVAQTTAENVSVDDRRRVVNAGVLRGRDANIESTQATVDVGFTMTMVCALATRGERLALIRVRVSGRDAETIQNDALNIVEIDAEERIAGNVVFDLDDFDAAFAELDARYIAGEAASHATTWSLIAGAFVALNRCELPATTTDVVSIDHRRGAAFAPGEGVEYVRAGWDLDQTVSLYIETAGRLNDRGAVFTWVGYGTSHEGFDAERRGVEIMTVDGDLLSRAEVFDEEDLDAALAKFDQLNRPTPRLENTASQMVEQFLAHFAVRDWDAMAELLADNFSSDDRRRVINAGIRRGRDVEMASWRTTADIWMTSARSTVVATRGECLALFRIDFLSPGPPSEAFHAAALTIIEVDDNNRGAANVVFDVDDIDAAFEELDARYLAGEAAPYRDAWSVITAGYAALNRYEVPPSAPDYVAIDHRLQHLTEAADLGENLRAAWDLTPELKGHVEVVHRLSSLGAVVTHAAHGTTQAGLDAEWRGIHFLTVECGMVNRCKVFFEADLDAALAKFNQLSIPALRLKNAVGERISAHISARDWDAVAQDFADDYCLDDRRRVVNAGVMHGRGAGVENTRVAAEVGLLTNTTSTIIASRGERLTLERFHASGADRESIQNEALNIVEIGADARIAAVVMFDVDDIDAAFAELDARYVAGEAAPHADTWSVIARIYAGFNRRESPATTQDSVFTDHRPRQNLGAVDLVAAIRSMWDVASDLNVCVEAVHRLSELGAVVTQTLKGTSQEGLDAEWRTIEIFTVEGDLLSRCEAFDETDLDAALARFEELQSQPPRLQNAASRVTERCRAVLRVRDWDAMAEILAEGFCSEDRRRVVNSGIRQGRDLGVKDMQAAVDVIGITYRTSVVIATRGERLELISARVSNDKAPETAQFEVLQVSEIDTDGRVAAVVTMDVDDMDAAFEELDARYTAGEAAAHAHTWSVIANATAAFNRHEMPSVTPHWVNIDHRRVTAFTPGDLVEYIRATWEVAPDSKNRIVAIHRLTDLGAVITQATHGTSREGFEAEWREITLLTVEGDSLNRVEIYDEADLDSALARFEELQPQPPRLENAASQLAERFWTYFANHEWAAMAEIIADNCCTHDRRRVVNADVLRGRAAHVTNMQAVAEVGFDGLVSSVLATREHRLALIRIHSSARGSAPGEVTAEMLSVVEIDADNRLAGAVIFESDDIDAAFEELDTRYLVGEAAVHSHTWSVVTQTYAAFNRHEILPTTPDWINVDHRRLARVSIQPNDMTTYLRAIWDLTPDFTMYAEAVHRLSERGAVVTHGAHGRSPQGLEAEWRMVEVLMVDSELISRCELFDEADLDAALARFEELQPQMPRLENAAGRIIERNFACFSARDWAAMAELLADDIVADDRRRVVNAGIRRGRDAYIADNQAAVEVGADTVSSSVIATRGKRLALARVRSVNRGLLSGEFGAEMLGVVEIDADERMVAAVVFDLEDVDAAFEELDARYLAGEAAAHAHTWSVIARTTDAFNRHELPAADGVNIDNRTLAPVDASDLPAFIRDTWDLTPDFSTHIEAVHRLSSFGAVVTYMAYGTSLEGFAAEWRVVDLLAVEGDRISRVELFDEADLDAALARFDELQPQMPRLENAASRIVERYLAHFAAHDWAAFAELLADDIVGDDRRRVVNSGVRGGRDVHIADMRAIVEVSAPTFCSSIIATRGERLALAHVRIFNRGMTSEVGAEALGIGEIDADERIVATISFDLDDIDAAFEELDTRYLAGEAAAHSDAWSVITHTYAAFNRHELAAADWVTIDHRPLVAIGPDDLSATIRAVWDLTPDVSIHVESVHRLSSFGAVVTDTMYGTSPEGFDVEWRMIQLLTVEAERIKRCEIFDEADLDDALAGFDEVERRTPPFGNAATRTWVRAAEAFNRRDMDGLLALASSESRYEDRRKGLRDIVEAPSWRKAVGAVLQTAPSSWRMEVEPIAVRGARFSLTRECYRDVDDADRPIAVELLSVVELDDNDLMRETVIFDPDDLDDAFAELTARWVASGEVAYPEPLEAVDRINATINRYDWEAVATHFAGAEYVNHRQLGHAVDGTIADWLSSLETTGSLVPNVWAELAEVLARCAIGIVGRMALKGTSTNGAAIEIPFVVLILLHGERVTRLEAFDEGQRDVAVARLQELNQPV
jgi:DNA-binding SARP family transcriptional activator